MTNKCREAFEAELKKLGTPDDEFNHYHLDEGNLYHIFYAAWQARGEQLPYLLEAQKTLAKLNEALGE